MNSPLIEPLEVRIAPAGLVIATYDAATGELTLTDNGGGLDNDVSVFQTGPNTHRIQGITTDINAAANTFLDIGKLNKVTIDGGGGSDIFTLLNLRTLTALSFTGGSGDDALTATNLAVKGAVEIHGNTGSDEANFDGLFTTVSGDVTADAAAGAADGIAVVFDAQKTVIGGSVLFTAGGDFNLLESFADGSVSIGKGVNLTSTTGTVQMELSPDGLLKIGKLATGESILFNGGSNDDRILLGAANAVLSGGIRMIGAGNDDSVEFNNGDGTAKVGKLPTGQSILFDAGAGSDSMNAIAASLTLAGGIDFMGGDNNNTFTLEAPNGTAKIGKLTGGQSLRFTGGTGADTIVSTSASLTLAGGIEFAAGDGDNQFDLLGGTAKIGKLATGQSLLFTGGTGLDIFATGMASLALAGGIEFAGGSNTNVVDLGSENGIAKIGKLAAGQSILFTGTGGADRITATNASLIFAGGIEFTAGDGANLIDFATDSGVVQLGKLATGQSILFTGGSGTDRITSSDLARITLAGGIELNGAGGGNQIFLDDLSTVKIGKFGTGRSVLFTGTTDADNELSLTGFVTTAGSLEVTGGTGSDEIEVEGQASIGKNAAGVSLLLTGGDGVDRIRLVGNVTVAGSMKLDGGVGNDTMDMFGIDTLSVKGAVEMDGGADVDRFNLPDAFSVFFGSTLTVNGGDGDDEVTMIADGTIAGNVDIDLGTATAGPQTVIFQSRTGLPGGLALKGSLLLDTASAAGIADSLTITNVSVAKLIDLKLGEGVSTVNIDNLNAGDEFKLDTRGGNDIVNIERGNFFGGSVIKKLATILTGDGDDQLAIGNGNPAFIPPAPDPTRVNFLGGLTADGGAGAADDRNDFALHNDFGVPLAPGQPVNFELMTL